MARKRGLVKILITGGHHTPALAVLSSLRKQLKIINYELLITWVGHRHSMSGDQSDSLEYKEVTSLDIPFIDLKAPKFYRSGRFFFFLRMLASVSKSIGLLWKVRPDLVLSFGGYLSSPLVFSAWALQIPVLTHEQTVEAGFANRFNARFCRKVLISFKSSLKYFPTGKTVVTGNPIRPEVFWGVPLFVFKENLSVIYFTGGKQGAHRLNQVILETLPRLLERYQVIHQSGSSTVFNDYLRLKDFAQGLPDDLKDRYLLKDHFGLEEIGSVLARADLVVSRSGANTVSELAVLNKKCLLIPLVGSSHREQEKNAQLLKDLGLAEIVEEEDLSGEKLYEAVVKSIDREAKIEKDKIEQLFPRDAADKIARIVLETIGLV